VGRSIMGIRSFLGGKLLGAGYMKGLFLGEKTLSMGSELRIMDEKHTTRLFLREPPPLTSPQELAHPISHRFIPLLLVLSNVMRIQSFLGGKILRTDRAVIQFLRSSGL